MVKRLPLNYKIMGNFNFYSLNNFINYFVPTKCFPFSLFVNMLYSVIRKEKQMFILRVPWTARRSNQSILKEINS